MTFQSHRKNKTDEEQCRESLSISDEDLREVEEEKSSSELQTRPEFKSRDDEKKDKPSVTSGKLVSATEEVILWEQTQTQETVRPVMLKRASGDDSHDSEDISVGKARDLAQDIVGKVIEEAKVRSRETSPAHYPPSSKT